MGLRCCRCAAAHDFDAAPDEGICLLCGGKLVEDGEAPETAEAGFQKAVEAAVSDGMVAATVARRRLSREGN